MHFLFCIMREGGERGRSLEEKKKKEEREFAVAFLTLPPLSPDPTTGGSSKREEKKTNSIHHYVSMVEEGQKERVEKKKRGWMLQSSPTIFHICRFNRKWRRGRRAIRRGRAEATPYRIIFHICPYLAGKKKRKPKKKKHRSPVFQITPLSPSKKKNKKGRGASSILSLLFSSVEKPLGGEESEDRNMLEIQSGTLAVERKKEKEESGRKGRVGLFFFIISSTTEGGGGGKEPDERKIMGGAGKTGAPTIVTLMRARGFEWEKKRKKVRKKGEESI